ncbi:MAG: class I SAM-dependent methyltransferase [Pseudomonadota bacterium]
MLMPDDWLESPQGRYIMDWEQQKIDALVSDIFGYNALQIGMAQKNLLRQSRIPLQKKVAERALSEAEHKNPTASQFGVDIHSDLRQLPFATQSIDLVVLPHVLEFHEDPHQILREVARILIPGGQLIIAGFNPLSLWGLRQHIPSTRTQFPWHGHYFSVARLKDWLKLLGCELERGHFGRYAPPCSEAKWFSRLNFMEAAGDRWWSFAGSVYLLRAIKRVHGMRLILPSWQAKGAPRKALSALTHQEIKQHEQ